MKEPDLSKLDKQQLITLIKLPDQLRETMLAIIVLGEATATEASKQTGKARATMSDHLNQLERMGYLKKRYASRKVYYSPK